jgi:hypothetical protein
MTATEDRIDKLFGQILIESIPRDEIEPELRTLFYAFDDPYYREKMQSAIDNAVAYANPISLKNLAGPKRSERFCFTIYQRHGVGSSN